MGRPKKSVSHAETQTDLPKPTFSLKDLRELGKKIFADQFDKLQGQIDNLQSKIESYEKQLKLSDNARLEDKEILMGLEYQMEGVVPDTVERIQGKLTEKFEEIEEEFEVVKSKQSINSEKIYQQVNKNKKDLDIIEQQLKARNVVIYGLVEDEEEDIKEKVVSLANDVLQLNNMKPTDIEQASRMGKKKGDGLSRNTFVKFRSKKARDDFYNKRKLTPIGEDVTRNIYINEDLTKHRSQLFHDARKLVKSRRLHSCWTQYGNIMMKRMSTDKPVAVYTHEELKRQCNQIDDMTLSSSSETEEL